MKRYLVRLTYSDGVSRGLSNYYPVVAKTAETAANKARRYISRNYQHSMHVPCVAGVQMVGADMEQKLKADIIKFQREIEEAELALNRAKNTLFDLKLRYNALQEFKPVDSQEEII